MSSKPPVRKPAGEFGKPGKKPSGPGKKFSAGGEELEHDNPGNPGVGVDDHVFFHLDGFGPHAGRVVAHGHHGCTVEDEEKKRHKVHWRRFLGLKQRAVAPMKVLDQGEGGSILQHEDGRRVFVAGELPVPVQAKPMDLSALEDLGRRPRQPRLADQEDLARSAGKNRDKELAKALLGDESVHQGSHPGPCEGPALCLACRGARLGGVVDLVKSLAAPVAALESEVSRLGARGGSSMLKSLGGGSRPLPVLLRRVK